MPRSAPAPVAVPLPNLNESLWSQTVEQLKWYGAALPDRAPTRKADLVDWLAAALTGREAVARLWARLNPGQQQVVAAIAYNHEGIYDADVLAAKYPGVEAPHQPQNYYTASYNKGKGQYGTPFDLFFYYQYQTGQYIPLDLAATVRSLAPPPLPTQLRSAEAPPTLPAQGEYQPEVLITDLERAVFHDLAATLFLIQQGKVTVSAATRLPTLPTQRQLRARLLVGDYFPDDYERAEDAMRPLALILLVQAARWAAPGATSGTKLELTKPGKAVAGSPVQPAQVREAWERWVKSDLLDELSRVRTIKGQQSKDARLSKPADRREKLATALRALPVGRWVTFDELLRYMRAEGLLPVIERNANPALYIGSSYYGMIEYSGAKYWDVVTGTYLRAVIWEYAATLGLVEIAYTRPEDAERDLGDLYLDDEYLSRYDGLRAVRLTPLGAYALGLTETYTPPAPVARAGGPLLKILPNLDLVITDANRILPNDRAFLERIGAPQSEDVYRLSRDLLLDGAQQGLTLDQVQTFLSAQSGVAPPDLPSTVRTFFADLARRLGALREGGRLLALESDDPLLLAELANDPALRGVAQLGKIGDRTVLLVDEDQEAAVRRQLKKLGYVPRK